MLTTMSHPVRDAWIEIERLSLSQNDGQGVASREGCVD